MPRPPRLHVQGALYYVTSRGIEGRPIFRDARDYDTYLELLKAYKQTHRFQLFAFALFPNQLQLCLQVNGDSTMSAVMHALNSRYTKYANKRHERSGHVFQERYRAVVVEKDPYLLRLTRYIHLVGVTVDGRTSLPYYGDSNSAGLVDVEEVLTRFRHVTPRNGYGEFLKAATPEELNALTRELQHPFVGSEAFVAALKHQAKEMRPAQQHAALPAEAPAQALVAPMPAHEPSRLRTMLTATATLGLVCAVLGATYLAGQAMTLAGKRVEVIVRQTVAAAPISSQRAGATLQTSVTTPINNPLNLNDTQWDIRFLAMSGSAAPAQLEGHLQFNGGKVQAEGRPVHGFPASNFTVTRQPDGAVVWETMQTSATGEVASWHGEWDGHVMKGVVTRQTAGGQAQDFTFLGVNRQATRELSTRSDI